MVKAGRVLDGIWMTGSRNASVLPEPVPVVTTTGRAEGESALR